MRFVFALLATTLLIGSASAPASAFDDKRQGFVLGFGVGPSLTWFKQEVSVFDSITGKSEFEVKAGLATTLKLGWGLNEHWVLAYDNRTAWFGLRNVFDQSVTIASSVSTASVIYYLEPSTPSLFFTGGIGLSTWGTPFESGTSTSVGFGVFAGGGIELTPRFGVEGSVEYGTPSDKEDSTELETDAVTLRLQLNLLGY